MIGPIVLFMLVCEVLCVRESKFYDLLGVTPDATPRQLKKAYRKLALQHHPDQGGDEEMFVKVSNAYEVLSDPEKKKVYDRYGQKGLDDQKQRGGGGGGGSHFDFFRQFTGGFEQHEQEEQRGQDIEMELEATLEQLFNGETIQVKVRNQMLCPKCFGTGAKSDAHIHQCQRCGGNGYIIQETRLGPGFVTRSQVTCDRCHGKGTKITEKCPYCHGEKLVVGDKTLTVDIERGMPNGEKIVFDHEADESPDHQAGHIVFRIATATHDRFQRIGNDLHMHTRISLKHALVGFTMEIAQLDGSKINFERLEVTKPDEIVKVAGEGMPFFDDHSRSGDMFLHFKIDFPAKITPEQKTAINGLL